MLKEEEKEFKEAMFDLHLQQLFYISEHKEPSEKIENDIKVLRRTYARRKILQKIGDVNDGKH